MVVYSSNETGVSSFVGCICVSYVLEINHRMFCLSMNTSGNKFEKIHRVHEHCIGYSTFQDPLEIKLGIVRKIIYVRKSIRLSCED